MDINRYIDHTLLRQGATIADLTKLCDEAKEHNFAAVCVAPAYVKGAKQMLEGTDVKVCTVIGFPFGYSSPDTKISEIEIAIADGADEIDIVHDVSLVKNGEWDELDEQMAEFIDWVAFVCETNDEQPIVKIILETGILTDAEIVKCCELYSQYKIDFIKTSTGFAAEPLKGDEFEAHKIKTIEIIRQNIPATMQIKASGGIRDYAFAKKLIDAGATRLGCSAGITIVEQSKILGGYKSAQDSIHKYKSTYEKIMDEAMKAGKVTFVELKDESTGPAPATFNLDVDSHIFPTENDQVLGPNDY